MDNYSIELLKEAGYSSEQLANMTSSQIRNLALEVEMELEQLGKDYEDRFAGFGDLTDVSYISK